jgi:hypothetical protein
MRVFLAALLGLGAVIGNLKSFHATLSATRPLVEYGSSRGVNADLAGVASTARIGFTVVLVAASFRLHFEGKELRRCCIFCSSFWPCSPSGGCSATAVRAVPRR